METQETNGFLLENKANQVQVDMLNFIEKLTSKVKKERFQTHRDNSSYAKQQ